MPCMKQRSKPSLLLKCLAFNDRKPPLSYCISGGRFIRGDVSSYMIRSTQSRVKYKEYNFELINPKSIIEKGDIIIESKEYTRYSGELQVALKDMENSGKSSVVGRVLEEELYLLDEIKPWQRFKFIKSNKK